MHPAFFVFAGIIALHGTIATLNLHSTLPAIYGVKLLVNVLFGFIVARQLIQPARRLAWLFAVVWLISVVGVLLDKFVYTFPWMGLETNIGGIQVDVSRGWDIDSGFDKRAAGFFRSSISAAMLLPILACDHRTAHPKLAAAAAVPGAHLRRGGTHHAEGCVGRCCGASA